MEIEFEDHFALILMFCERDVDPFDRYCLGHFENCDDGYWRFKPNRGVAMTCKQLREAATKASELNK